MRLSTLFTRLGVFLLAALLSVVAARAAVAVLEDRSVLAVQERLIDNGHDWATVQGDGLQIVIEGQAPTEATRFRAMTAAGTVVDASRVIDNMSVADTGNIAPPQFAIEILRNDSGVSLIGLMPAATDRDRVLARIDRIAGDAPVTDLLDVADYPMPDGWEPSLEFSLRALDMLDRAKISVSAGGVSVTANSDSEQQRSRFERELTRLAPDEIQLTLDISAPRPVITPFTTRFILDENGARFGACAADTEEARSRIIAAATDAGFEGKVSCVLGLGVPTGTWGLAVSRSIGAIADLEGGTVTVSDADILLVAPEGTAQARFDEVVGRLENSLPDVFSLEAVLPQPPEETDEGPPQFVVTLSPEGLVQLRGRVADDLANITVENFAKARFGNSEVDMRTRVAPDGLPMGWNIRVLAGLQALSHLSNGSVMVEPAALTVRGDTGNRTARDEITRLLIERLGPEAEFSVDVTYVERLDPIAALPTPEECVAQVGSVTSRVKITFEPGSATIDAGTLGAVDEIAEILQKCADIPLEIAGYTDSQGREEMNAQLSQQRAEAVLSALRQRRVPTSSFVAVGYGEADPIADNDTAEGREANRRIEFTLVDPDATDGEDGADETAAEETDQADEQN